MNWNIAFVAGQANRNLFLEKLAAVTLAVHVCEPETPDELQKLENSHSIDLVIIWADSSGLFLSYKEKSALPVLAIVPDDITGQNLTRLGANDYLVVDDLTPRLIEKSILLAAERSVSSHTYEALFIDAPAPMWAFDPDSLAFVLVNNAAIAQYGYSREEFLSMTVKDLRPSEDVPKFLSIYDKLLFSNKAFHTYEGEWRHKKKDGTLIDIQIKARMIVHKSKPLLLVVLEDITEKKNTLKILREKEEQLRHAIAQGKMFIMDIDYETRQVYFSQEAESVFGPGIADRMLLDDVLKLVHPDDLPIVHRSLANFQSGKVSQPQFRVVRPGGKIVWLERRAYLSYDADNKAKGTKGLLVDITSSKIAEHSLVESYRQLEIAASQQASILNALPAHIALLNGEGRIIAVNAQWRKFGDENRLLTPDHAVGESYFTDPTADGADDIQLLYDRIKAVLSGQIASFSHEYPCHSPSQLRWFNMIVSGLGNAGSGAVVMHVDITERKKAEINLEESEKRFRALIENSGDMFIAATHVGVPFYCSPNLENILGYDLTAIENIIDLIHSEEREKFVSVIQAVTANKGRLFHHLNRVKSRTGDWIWVEGSIVNLDGAEPVSGLVWNFRDISGRMKIELDLRRSQFFLEKAMHMARLGYWIFDVKKYKIHWSTEISSILNVTKGDVDPSIENYYSVIHPADLDVVKNTLSQSVSRKEALSYTFRAKRGNGSECWLQVDSELILEESGEVDQVLLIAQDITDLKLKEKKLRESKNNLDALINSTDDIIWAIDRDGTLVNANTAYHRIIRQLFHVTVQTEKQAVLLEAPGDLQRLWSEKYREALDGIPVSFEYVSEVEGQIRTFDVRLNPIVDGSEVVGVSGYSRDISDRKRSEKAIREINQRYEILSRATNDAVWDWDIASNQVRWNHGLEHLFGYRMKPDQEAFSWWESRMHSEDRQRVIESLEKCIRDKANNWSQNYRFLSADGSYKYVFDRCYVVYDNGQAIRMIGAMQDIHELTEYRLSLEQKVIERTKELEDSIAKEKELAELKNRFVSIASHEFRTPLSTIEFATDYLQSYRQKLSEDEIVRKLETIQKQVHHMTFLLDDVLAVGKSDAGKISVVKTEINLRDFLDETLKNTRLAGKYHHQVNLLYHVGHDQYETDEKLLQSILTNLLSNAMKFSPGEEEIILKVVETGNTLNFEVTDHGIGISSTDLKNIFEPFTRGRNVGTIAGTGLGLTIVKRAVDLLGGSIHVNSDENSTTFSIVLPR